MKPAEIKPTISMNDLEKVDIRHRQARELAERAGVD